MKKYLLIVLTLLLNSHFLFISAANGGSDDGLPIDIEFPDDNRPRSLAPDCYYLDGYVFIIGGSGITGISATVTRLSDNAQWSDNSYSNTLQMAVPSDAGTYRLLLMLSDGSSYYGDYTLF